MAYVLDTQIVSWFFQVEKEDDLANAAAAVPFVIVKQVHDELARDPKRGRRFRTWLPKSRIGVVEIESGSQEARVLAKLQPPLKDLREEEAELACIAISSAHPDHVFAGMDKNGMWIAFRELRASGERILSLPVLLHRLVEKGALPITTAQLVMKRSMQAFPTWWYEWLAKSL